VPHEDLLRRINDLTHESVAVRFERMALDLQRLAARVDKPAPTVLIESNDVHLPASRFASFWQSTVHVLRNLMDHGIEPEAERIASGKSGRGAVTLRSSVTREGFRIEFGDDGRGVDWAKIALRAEKAGLPAKTQKDLERALFSAGVSTADEVSELSGRGVGLSAVEEHCIALGGKLRVESTHGIGTRFIVEFPRRGNEDSIIPGPPTRVGKEQPSV
jgi:two-component system chemotaxis sensor kinase CheA